MMMPADAPILTVDAMRAAEHVCTKRGTSLSLLMERAGRAVADAAWRVAAGRPILILCGTGNNGGDGYVAARILAARGVDVTVAALGPAKTDLARAARQGWDGAVLDLADAALLRPAVMVDALFGVGMSRPLDTELRQMLAPLGAARVISVDVPSGVDADGVADWAPIWPAHVTVALGALKPAHVLQPSAAWCGQIYYDDLGEKGAWASRARSIGLGGAVVAAPSHDAHKFTRGMVLVASGPMGGAARLCAGAAMRAGAGYVVMRGGDAARNGTPPYDAIITEDRERFSARYQDKRVGAAVIGAGYPDGEALRQDVAELWDSGLDFVLDAAAIDVALGHIGAQGRDVGRRRMVMTPHEGEFQRAFGAVLGLNIGGDATENKMDRARRAAAFSGAVVIYKGADLVISAPDGRLCAAWPGSPWLASAGTGDVLAGATAAMLARGGDAFQAAVDAVRWHIRCAQRIGPGLIADDMIRI
ncbi:NAD(P)H-hydrate epimerase [Sphingopyxis yananensis]|uniref:NAD(P)H-hydrate epimerase n=1 Tax=Sphingopyxis yananensis TaxID=2886687 RepID=UPI001D121C25|nr:NAD(P)H-hydrate epimerase [Sphingopyxis yananensis]MCC2603575.1 NAD(P)H-hydrate epimerase [Sphingopyxis yananensis]